MIKLYKRFKLIYFSHFTGTLQIPAVRGGRKVGPGIDIPHIPSPTHEDVDHWHQANWVWHCLVGSLFWNIDIVRLQTSNSHSQNTIILSFNIIHLGALGVIYSVIRWEIFFVAEVGGKMLGKSRSILRSHSAGLASNNCVCAKNVGWNSDGGFVLVLAKHLDIPPRTEKTTTLVEFPGTPGRLGVTGTVHRSWGDAPKVRDVARKFSQMTETLNH